MNRVLTLEDLNGVTDRLTQAIGLQTAAISDLTTQVKQLKLQLDAEDKKTPEFDCATLTHIKTQLEFKNASDAFLLEIKNVPKRVLATLDLDLSYYLTNNSEIYETIVDAGYDLNKMHNVDDAIYKIFSHGLIYSYMPEWRRIIARINQLINYEPRIQINWSRAIDTYTRENKLRSDVLSKYPHFEMWDKLTDTLHRNMATADARERVCKIKGDQ